MNEITKEDWKKVCDRGNILPPVYGDNVREIIYDGEEITTYYDTSFVDYHEYSFSSWRPDPERIGEFKLYEVDETDLSVGEETVYIYSLAEPFNVLNWTKEDVED
ncbi:hypothetical protein [Facklamia hominis]|uniref:hypothetical protein n=1 Tax=Facklamia hominis TaxID=178214 RepID=UPI0038FCAAEF